MRKSFGLAAALSFAMLASASMVQASTVFAFSGPEGPTETTNLGTTEQYMMGGITLDVTATGGNINRNSAGIGVDGPVNQNILGPGEALDLMVSTTVSLLEALIFERQDGTDTVKITNLGDSSFAMVDVTNNNGSSSFFDVEIADLVGLTALGNAFRFEVTGSTGDVNRQGVRLSSVTVAAVPLPAAGFLLLGALGGLGLIRRRGQS